MAKNTYGLKQKLQQRLDMRLRNNNWTKSQTTRIACLGQLQLQALEERVQDLRYLAKSYEVKVQGGLPLDDSVQEPWHATEFF